MSTNSPQLDERVWQAWIQKNEAQDHLRFRRRVKVIGLVALCLALSALLFEIHKVSADVFELRPMPGFRSKTVLRGSSIPRCSLSIEVDRFSDHYGSRARSSSSPPITLHPSALVLRFSLQHFVRKSEQFEQLIYKQ